MNYNIIIYDMFNLTVLEVMTPMCPPSFAGVVCIASRCAHLQVVYLRRCLRVNDAAVQSLAEHCRQLRDLNLGGCHLVTDRSLASLGENSRLLNSVNVSGSSVSTGATRSVSFAFSFFRSG